MDEFPEILAKIQSGEYTVRVPTDKKKYSSELTWSAMRLIFDETNIQVQDFFYCSKCHKIFNLNLRNSGQSLKRHVEKTCRPIAPGGIEEYFEREFQPTKKKKITIDDKIMIRDAAVTYIVSDMRPISSLNGDGMAQLLSKMTSIGSRYGHITENMMSEMKLVPSRQTVSFFYSVRTCGFAFLLSNLMRMPIFADYAYHSSLCQECPRCVERYNPKYIQDVWRKYCSRLLD